MCLVTTNEKFILDNDIFVWKKFQLINGKIKSLYYNVFHYYENNKHVTEIQQSDDIRFFDNYACRYNNNIFANKSYGEGFHSALSIERLSIYEIRDNDFYDYMDNILIYKCKIAKGSECVIDDSGLIISNSIQLLNRVYINEYKMILNPLINKLKTVNNSEKDTALFLMLETSYSEIYKYLKLLCA